MRPVRTSLPLALALLLTLSASAQSSDSLGTALRLKQTISYLASDQLMGRAAGTEGNVQAANYIADKMEEYGLTPAAPGESFFQPLQFVSAVRLGNQNTLTLSGPPVPGGERTLKPDEDFRPLAFSASQDIKGPLVFAGYGISAPDIQYDDYANLDVRDKVVVVLRYGPDGTGPQSKYTKYSSFRNKVRVARDKGAAAVLITSGPLDDEQDELVKLMTDRSFEDSGIPAASIKRQFIEELLTARGKNLRTLQDSIRSAQKPLSFEISGVQVHLSTDIVKVMAGSTNVAGYLEGNDPSLKNEVIIIGAHFDHLGRGGPGSGSMVPDTDAVHHGADDNASGVAGMLELARRFSEQKDELRRTMLFLSFTGEELGTLGSSYYVNHPLLPLAQTVAMINLDMVGRLDNRQLTVHGVGTSPLFNQLVSQYNADSAFSLHLVQDGFGPSDQTVFYGKDIPVLFFWTGTHNDYHKPSDTWDKINYMGEARIVDYVYNIVHDIDRQPQRPAFVRTAAAPSMASGDSRSFTVTLGIIPDFTDGGQGMRVSGVRPGGPAERAGLLSGDVIVKLAGKKIMNIYDYMGVLGELKAGDHVQVDVVRNGKTLTLETTMDRRK